MYIALGFCIKLKKKKPFPNVKEEKVKEIKNGLNFDRTLDARITTKYSIFEKKKKEKEIHVDEEDCRKGRRKKKIKTRILTREDNKSTTM